MFSMQCSSCFTLKMKFMDPTSSNHLQTLKMMKNDGKSRLYSITDDTDKDTNTTSYGKDGQSPMQHGNLPCVSKMVVKPYSKNIDTDSTYKQTQHYAQQGNPDNYLHVSRRRSGRPSYPLSWWLPVWLPCIPFQPIFPLSKNLPQSSPIIHLGQQIQCIASYIDLVDKMLYNSTGTDAFLTLNSSGNTNLALAVFSCLWESLIVFANDWVHFGV